METVNLQKAPKLFNILFFGAVATAIAWYAPIRVFENTYDDFAERGKRWVSTGSRVTAEEKKVYYKARLADAGYELKEDNNYLFWLSPKERVYEDGKRVGRWKLGNIIKEELNTVPKNI